MRFLIALLALAGLFDSYKALQIHNQDPASAPPCAVTAQWDCGTVNHSRYSTFPAEGLFEDSDSKAIHIPVADLGMAGYAIICLLALAKQYKLTLAASLIGLGFAGYLSYLEALVIHKWCIYCVWSQSIMAAIVLCTVIALVLNGRKRRFEHSAFVAS